MKLKGCTHYESKVIKMAAGGSVGGTNTNDPAGPGGYGGSGNSGVSGGINGGAGGKGVSGTGLSTGTTTGSKASGPAGGRSAYSEAMHKNFMPAPVVMRRIPRAVSLPVPVGYSPKKPVGRITSITGGYEIQGYGPTPGTVQVNMPTKQYYDRIAPHIDSVNGGGGQLAYSKGGPISNSKKGYK